MTEKDHQKELHTSRTEQQAPEAGRKSRVPYLFNLDVDDITHPITIRRRRILQAVVILILASVGGYFVFRAPSDTEVVNEWVEAAGGMEAWNAVEHGSFVRNHKLFSETGEMYSEKSETFYFDKKDGNVKLLVRSQDNQGNEIWIGKDKEGYWASNAQKEVDPKEQARDLGMMCNSEWCSPDCAASMAFYRFSMPFKLTDDGVVARYEGTSMVGNVEMKVLDITYRPGVGRDRWVFYAHPDDLLIRKIEYHHSTDKGESLPEDMFWSDYRKVGGLQIAHKWTRYWTNGNVLEEYTYSDIDFTTPLPGFFEQRPDFEIAGMQ